MYIHNKVILYRLFIKLVFLLNNLAWTSSHGNTFFTCFRNYFSGCNLYDRWPMKYLNYCSNLYFLSVLYYGLYSKAPLIPFQTSHLGSQALLSAYRSIYQYQHKLSIALHMLQVKTLKPDIHFPEESSRLQNVGQERAACQGVDYCCPLMAAWGTAPKSTSASWELFYDL